MRKLKTSILWTLSAACLAATMFFGVACKDDSGNGEESSSAKTSVMAPEILATDEGLSWTSVTGASSYEYRLGEGAWTTAQSGENQIAFPQTVGSYTFEVVAKGSADYADSESAQYAFTVSEMASVTAQCVGNTVVFDVDDVYYSVNGGEFGKITEGKTVDFSNLEKGTAVALECYQKGGFFNAQSKTYYLDGQKTSVSLTVRQALATPTLSYAEESKSLTWSPVTGAAGYEVTVNGTPQTVTQTAYAVDTTAAGALQILVKAKAAEGSTDLDSNAAQFEVNVAASYTPELTYAEGKVYVDALLAPYFEASVGGASFAKVNASQADNAENCKFRIASRFDAENKIIYPESRTVAYVTRPEIELALSAEGVISWNESDSGDALSYSYDCYQTTPSAIYSTTKTNTYNVSELAAGEYVFKIYGNSYQSQTGNDVIFYLNSAEKEIDFTVLSAPQMKNGYGKFTFDAVDLASGYRYKLGQNGTWQTLSATEASVSDMGEYYIQALGNGESNVINSKIVSQYLEPSLKEGAGKKQLANFDKTQYTDRLEIPSVTNASTTGTYSILKSGEGSSTAENDILSGATGSALKLTAGKAAPRNVNEPGNCDGVTYRLVEPLILAEVNKVVFRLYIQSSETITSGALIFSVRGVSALDGAIVQGATWTESKPLATDTWVEYTLDLTRYRDGQKKYGTDEWATIPMLNVTDFSVLWCDIGAEGDTFYIDEIYHPVAYKFAGNSLTFTEAENANYLGYSQTTQDSSVEGGVLSMQLTGNTNLIEVYFDGRTLENATITIVADFGAATNSNSQTTQGGGIYVNDSSNADWKKNFANQDGEQTLSFTYSGTLEKLIIKNYGPYDTRTIKITSITIS